MAAEYISPTKSSKAAIFKSGERESLFDGRLSSPVVCPQMDGGGRRAAAISGRPFTAVVIGDEEERRESTELLILTQDGM